MTKDEGEVEPMNDFAFDTQYLSFTAIFACISIGFAFLRSVDREERGIAYWSTSFALNSLGFLLWSNVIHFNALVLFLAGDIFHMLGFLTLVWGAYRFFGKSMRVRAALALAFCAVFWLAAIFSFRSHQAAAVFMLRLLRAIIFVFAAAFLFLQKPGEKLEGKTLAASSLLIWGVYVLVTAIWRVVKSYDLQFGIMSGFHILAAFGMVAMVVDRIRHRANAAEKQVARLEGLLPICSYCKKIRDDKNQWQTLELYIEDRSAAEFSHGICPDCMNKHRPDVDK
jgi:hypothetical protein